MTRLCVLPRPFALDLTCQRVQVKREQLEQALVKLRNSGQVGVRQRWERSPGQAPYGAVTPSHAERERSAFFIARTQNALYSLGSSLPFRKGTVAARGFFAEAIHTLAWAKPGVQGLRRKWLWGLWTEVGPPERDKTDGPLGLNDVWVGGCSASNRLYWNITAFLK